MTGATASGGRTSPYVFDGVYLAIESEKLRGKQTSHMTCYSGTDLTSLSTLTVTVELQPSVTPRR